MKKLILITFFLLFQTNFILKTNNEKTLNKKTKTSKIYECEFCCKQEKNKKDLLTHILEKHIKNPAPLNNVYEYPIILYQCPCCVIFFYNSKYTSTEYENSSYQEEFDNKLKKHINNNHIFSIQN